MAISPSSPLGAQREHQSKRWWRSKAIGGRSRIVLRPRRMSSDSITTRADPGMAGIATPSLIRWSIQEVRRIAVRLARKRIQPAHVIAWSLWRRAHQAVAQRAHLKAKRQL